MSMKFAFTLAVLLSCGAAFWRGRDSERLTALVLLICAAASALAETSRFWEPESGILLIDLALLSFLVVLALRTDRFWPLYATAFQAVGTLVHIARFADQSVWHSAYAAAQIFWAYPVLLALMVGTLLEARYRPAEPAWRLRREN